jgi:tetraacyldisaccharide 4'-kinase
MAYIMKKLTQWFNQLWYQNPNPAWWMQCFSKVYQLGFYWDKKRKKTIPSPLPVIVVGNLTVGGTGKTPVVIALCQFLQQKGYRVGIVTRGYQHQLSDFPYHVKENDSAQIIGDEAALIAQKTKVPIVIAPQRASAIRYLHEQQLCDIIISDDGLQHHPMGRQLEIVVIDGQRGFGNGFLLPAGPLREPLDKLNAVDLILVNGKPSTALSQKLKPYTHKTFIFELKSQTIEVFNKTAPNPQEPYAAFAGIGNPERFFNSLRELNIQFSAYSFPDHHRYVKKDFDIPESCIIMTEKDAIKCHAFSQKPILVLPVFAEFPSHFWDVFSNSLG